MQLFMFTYMTVTYFLLYSITLFQLAIYINIKLYLELKKMSIFQKPKPAVENLILDSNARKLGMLLKKALEKLQVLRSLTKT